MRDEEFRGRGWAFPVTTDRTEQVGMAENERDIEESIRIILGTARGERVMRPTFGCRIHDFVFEVVNATTLHRLEDGVREALVEWEPRIELLDVNASTAEIATGRLLISVDYRIRQTNTEFNLVYPFYLREGRDGE